MTIQIPIWQWAIAKLTGLNDPSFPIDTKWFILHQALPSASSPSPTGAC